MPGKPAKITAYESRTYDVCGTKQFPVLDYQGVSYCQNCGKCCWDWKGNNPKDKCEHLGTDMKTCQVFKNPSALGACGGLDSNWPQPYHYVDLSPDCGYMILWKSKGWVV
jgi:hypothetical protein